MKKMQDSISKLFPDFNLTCLYPSKDLTVQIMIKNMEKSNFECFFFTDHQKPLILHWGFLSNANKNDWRIPPENIFPPGTKIIEKNKSIQTIFSPFKDCLELKFINIKFINNVDFSTLIFVFHEPKTNIWYNNGGKDYRIPLFLESQKNNFNDKSDIFHKIDLIDIISECELNNSWTLMHRYKKCHELLKQIDMKSKSDIIIIYVWLRLSSMRQLTWQRNYNTQPRDLTHSQNILSSLLVENIPTQHLYFLKEKNSLHLIINNDYWLRQSLICIGKGGTNGQEIRDNILVIIHKNRIGEKHDHFYEQWHQKLHNNTTPDDIYICEALLNFLKSNDISKYWDTLLKNGITKERLMSFERRIVAEPYYAPHLIGDFENYLKILKKVHSSTDLETNLNSAKQYFNNEQKEIGDFILKNIESWDIILLVKKCLQLRESLTTGINLENDKNKRTEFCFLDISLEQLIKNILQRNLKLDLSNYLILIFLILKHIFINLPWCELEVCLHEFESRFKNEFSQENLLIITSSIERIKRLIGCFIDYVQNNFQNVSLQLGKKCGCNENILEIFSEELIRGSIFSSLSTVIQKTEKILSQKTGQNDFLIISQKNEIFGKIIFSKNIPKENFDEPTILVINEISGEEDIPENINGIILYDSFNYPDILAHVSVRARNSKILFIVSMDKNDPKIEKLKVLRDKYVHIHLKGEIFEINEISKEELMNQNCKEKQIFINNNINYGYPEKYIILMEEFENSLVGQKSLNIKKIYGKLEEFAIVPESIAIPFNAIEEILNNEINLEISKNIHLNENFFVNNFSNKNLLENLENCKTLINNLKYPENDKVKILKEKLREFGLIDFEESWKFIKKIYASKFNERAYLALRKFKFPFNSIRMSILVQKVISSEYSFVIHTKNPITNDENSLYGEIVKGMGETLVGNYPGQAYSFTYNKQTKNINMLKFANKNIGLEMNGFMFRSDSNVEDLEGFAGAGLFDSLPSGICREMLLDYTNDLMMQKDFRNKFIEKISQIGVKIEQIFDGKPQDIEGCYFNSTFYVVQTRPQV